MTFAYLLDKIRDAAWLEEPFRHIEIDNLFSADHFAEITAAREIALRPAADDRALFGALFDAGYKIIDFPGCITDREAYMQWHSDKSLRHNFSNSSCEGFGMTLRLLQPATPIIAELNTFLKSQELWIVLARKFGLGPKGATFSVDVGIQKYLDGYEISPHPDIRRKALTFMVNINPSHGAEDEDHHTHYLRFKKEYRYVQAYWEGNPDKDRCWVPWAWCETAKVQRKNNSIVIFSPGDHTLHAVKASYDHLPSQRTQLYGNLWYRNVQPTVTPAWENFVVGQASQQLRTNPPRKDDAVVANRLGV